MNLISFTFLGTGTSAGIPMIGCDCRVCTSSDPRDRRSRCSIVVSYGQTRVLIDTTPELRLQAVACGINRIDAVVFTHAHADHIMGMDDVRRFNAIAESPIDAWADPRHFETIDRCFGYAFRPPTEQGVFRPQLVYRPIGGPFEINEQLWIPVPLMHGSGHVLGFRIGNMAYCTDVSHVPETSLELLKGLDVLVIGALQHRKHPTHFTISEALQIVDMIKPRRTLFTHMSHNVLHAEVQEELPAGVELAYDGLVI